MTIWCVGRNYIDHAKELGNEVPKEPLFFIKSEGCLHQDFHIPYPDHVKSLHYELEMALKFNSQLEPVKIGLALDLTDRISQNEAKKKGTPWSLAKSFKGSCPLSPWVKFDPQENYHLELNINGLNKQQGQLSDMVFKPIELIRHLKKHFPLAPNDILLTGTPAGVGELRRGDILSAHLKNSKEKILIEWNSKVE
ncbi:MAG: fumarylacetoacetate hydrolase family protein [Bdellovibrionales bacterium]|nr:fumarylacetoacetate hydrolase family protein [Bdellovibrionales bacterium]